MIHHRTAFVFALALAPAVNVAGCANDDTADRIEADELDNEAKADGITYPVGTYELSLPSSPDATDFQTLVLMSDRTFRAEQTGGFCGPACDETLAGTYKFTRSTTTSKKYLRFTLDDGTDLGRWVWTLSKDVLKLTPDGTKLKQEMLKAIDAWCESASQCDLQNLESPEECEGEWGCEADTCRYACASEENSCEAAGGTCVGLSPSSCEDGVVGDASTYSCGGGLGVMCCLPKPEAPPGAPLCKAVGDGTFAWFSASGYQLCEADCEDAVAECNNVGSRSEGWYTASGRGCRGEALIAWDQCSD